MFITYHDSSSTMVPENRFSFAVIDILWHEKIVVIRFVISGKCNGVVFAICVVSHIYTIHKPQSSAMHNIFYLFGIQLMHNNNWIIHLLGLLLMIDDTNPQYLSRLSRCFLKQPIYTSSAQPIPQRLLFTSLNIIYCHSKDIRTT